MIKIRGIEFDDIIKGRFFDKIEFEPMSGCWLWSGATLRVGYGVFQIGKSAQKVHRISYLIHRGEIKQGQQVNHKCDVRCCVNPAHLWLGTQKDNIRDAVAKGRMSQQKITHCPYGHPLSGDNLILHKRKSRPNPGRECRICVNKRQIDNRSRRKSNILSPNDSGAKQSMDPASVAD